MMEDKLQHYFLDYNPSLSSDKDFMMKLNQNLENAELIKSFLEKNKRKNRMNVIAVSIVWFIIGMIFMAAYPYLSNMVLNIFGKNPHLFDHVSAYADGAINLIIGLCILAVMLATYDIMKPVYNRLDKK